MSDSSRTFVSRFVRDESGQILPWMVLLMVLFLGMAGLTLDLGHAYVCYRTLQASTDAAALAGAYEMGVTGATSSNVTTYVNNYSSKPGGANINPNLPSSTVVVTPTMGCEAFATTEGTPCIYVGSNNALRVVQTATVPTMFIQVLSVFGVNSAKSITLKSTAIAAVKGAAPAQYNVAMVVDTTASMASSDNDAACGNTRIYCALQGVQTMLNLLQPCEPGATSSSCTPFDEVSLFTFPPVTANSAKDDTTCPSSNPTIVPYPTPGIGASWTPINYNTTKSTAGSYQITNYDSGWSSTNQTGGSLNTSDPITIATGGGVSTKKSPCGGMQTPGGDGTYYAGAIYAAASSLVYQQSLNPGSVNALIVLSDGDADSSVIAGATNNGATYGSAQDQCAQAVAAAQYASSLPNTTVYTIAYGSPSSGCASDVKSKTNPAGTGITPCQTLQQMSSGWSTGDYSNFFTDATATGSGGCNSPVYSTLSLNQIFTALTNSLGRARLIPSNIAWT